MPTKTQWHKSYHPSFTEEKTESEVVSRVTESINNAVNFYLNPSLFDHMQVLSCFHFVPIYFWRDKGRVEHPWDSQQKKIPDEVSRTLLFPLPSCSNKITWSPQRPRTSARWTNTKLLN